MNSISVKKSLPCFTVLYVTVGSSGSVLVQYHLPRYTSSVINFCTVAFFSLVKKWNGHNFSYNNEWAAECPGGEAAARKVFRFFMKYSVTCGEDNNAGS
jgi:hypothetical protein